VFNIYANLLHWITAEQIKFKKNRLP